MNTYNFYLSIHLFIFYIIGVDLNNYIFFTDIIFILKNRYITIANTMILFKNIIFYAFLSFLSIVTFAQKPDKPAKAAVVKFKPPKVKTFWGNQSDTPTISKEEALQLLSLPIRVMDEKKVSYTINSYQFLYRRKDVAQDEATGAVTPTQTISANVFRFTPLPEVWQNSIRDQLQSGEELHYFDVIVKDNQGRLFFAPELKIKIRK